MPRKGFDVDRWARVTIPVGVGRVVHLYIDRTTVATKLQAGPPRMATLIMDDPYLCGNGPARRVEGEIVILGW